jgi:YesN/AraC family two-component response regulator
MKSISNTIPSISILMVEDEAITLEFLFITLAKKYPGFKLYQALDGKAGLELFKTHTPDIVITDLSMPEISGVQMAEKIREIKPDTKFIIITGNMEKLSGEVSVENESAFENYISKPVDFLDLFTAIEKCVDEIKLIQQ